MIFPQGSPIMDGVVLKIDWKVLPPLLEKLIIHIDIAIYYWIDWFIFRYCQIVVNFIEIVFFNSYSLFSIFYLHNLYQRYFSFLSLQLAPPIHVMAVVMDNFS